MYEAESSSPITVGRRVGKTRGPVVVWLLSAVTLGIYYLVWWYKINREVRDFDPSIEVSPGTATLAVATTRPSSTRSGRRPGSDCDQRAGAVTLR